MKDKTKKIIKEREKNKEKETIEFNKRFEKNKLLQEKRDLKIKKQIKKFLIQKTKEGKESILDFDIPRKFKFHNSQIKLAIKELNEDFKGDFRFNFETNGERGFHEEIIRILIKEVYNNDNTKTND